MRPAARAAVSVEPELARDSGKRLIEDVDTAHCFVLSDDQRRVNANNVRIRHCDQATFQRLMEQGAGNRPIQRHLGRAIGNQFDADHQATSTDVADEAIFVLQLLECIEHQRADPGGIFDELFIEDGLDGGQAGRSGQWISAVAGRTPTWLSERFGGHTFERRRDGTEWKTAAYALADRHDVGLKAELFGRPHRSRSAEAGQDFICDEQRAEFICDFPYGVNEVVGRDDVARRALHRFQYDRCNFILRIVLYDVAQMFRAREAARRIFELPGAAIAVGIRRQVHPRLKGSLVVAVATSEQADYTRGLSVVAAPEPDKLEFLGDRFGETESGLDCLRAA